MNNSKKSPLKEKSLHVAGQSLDKETLESRTSNRSFYAPSPAHKRWQIEHMDTDFN